MFVNIWGWVKALLGKLLGLFGLGGPKALPAPSHSEPEMMSVFVRTNLGEKVHLELAPDWTVAMVKAQLVTQLNTSSQHIRLIFAGKELPDSLVLRDCDLGQNSVLHAIRIVTTDDDEDSTTPVPPAASSEGTPLSQTFSTTTIGSDIKESKKEPESEVHDVQKRLSGIDSSYNLEEKTGRTAGVNSHSSAASEEEKASNTSSDEPGVEAFTVVERTDVEEAEGAGESGAAVGPGCGNPCQRLLCDARTVITIQLTQEEQEQLKQLKEASSRERPHFYVYCVRPCAGVRVGKLRVRCASCKQGAITLHADPTCWSDVLNDNKVLCSCATPECSERSEDCYAEFYFKCGDHVTTGDDDVAVPLYLIRSNLPGVVCLSCGDVANPVIVFQCEASHVTCLDCFITYCLSKLSERQFTFDPVLGYTLPCPINCPDSLIVEVHHFRLLGDEQYARYQHWGAEEAVLAAGGVLCPRPGCGHGLLPDPDCVRITCVGGCDYVFCRHCLQDYHTGECWQPDNEPAPQSSAPIAFSVNPSRSGGGRWDVASAAVIQSLTKPCPKCRTPTERSGGCMHMVCTRASCRHNWCWVCHTEWTRDCMASHWFG